jgi:hypothetical protein
MGDFIRYILTEPHDLTLERVEKGLKQIDPEFAIVIDQAAANMGDVLLEGEIFGEIELNRPEDQVFDEDIEDLREQLVDIPPSEKTVVMKALAKATGMIAFQLSEEGHDHYGRIDPFWDWLFVHYSGLLQIDDEGYYNQDDQVLEID